MKPIDEIIKSKIEIHGPKLSEQIICSVRIVRQSLISGSSRFWRIPSWKYQYFIILWWTIRITGQFRFQQGVPKTGLNRPDGSWIHAAPRDCRWLNLCSWNLKGFKIQFDHRKIYRSCNHVCWYSIWYGTKAGFHLNNFFCPMIDWPIRALLWKASKWIWLYRRRLCWNWPFYFWRISRSDSWTSRPTTFIQDRLSHLNQHLMTYVTFMATSMLVTNIGDKMCWWQF